MRVALINSPSLTRRPVSRTMAGGLGFDGSEHLLLAPLDLALMAATLRQQGEAVTVIDADPLRLTDAGVYARLGNEPWDVLIASVSLPSLDADAAFLAGLRRRYPSATVIGKTLIRDARTLEDLLRQSGAAFVIHGEPELSIGDLIHGRTRGGTAWLEPDSAGAEPRLHVDEGEPIADLNQLPLPARDLLPNERYVYPLLGTPVATLQTSRGCPYPCGYYCPYPLVEGVKWRAQSPERIAAELAQVVETFGITKVYFRDATFTLNQERITRLCDLILRAGWKLEWVCETRVDCLSEALLATMRAAGCVGILIGVETGDEQVMHLREGKKGLTVSKLAVVREAARRLGIRVHFLLIVGLPQETRESIVATYDLIRRYEPDTVGVTVITPYPGTPLYEEAVRQGWIDSLEASDYGGHQVPMHTPHLSREDLLRGKRWLEEGFAIVRRRAEGQEPALVETLAVQHYEQLLRWAYGLDGMAATVRGAMTAARSVPALVATQTPGVAPQAAAMAVGKAMRAITVVMPTYNRRAILRKTLLAFASQTVPADQFELLVVDDGSPDDTVAMARAFKAPFRLRVLTQSHQGPNAARNLAIRAAEGEIVLLTGDDMIPEPNFLEEHLKFHRLHAQDTDAMLGFIDWSPEIPVTPFMEFIVAPEGGQQFSFGTIKDGQADFRMFYTSNVSVKRALLARQSVLFDPDFVFPAFDDVEFGYRLALQGMRLTFNARAITKHHHEITPASFAERQQKAGQMAVVLARKHPRLDEFMVRLHELPPPPPGGARAMMQSLLTTIDEVEKADPRRMEGLVMKGMRFSDYYLRVVVHPLYTSLLTLAYQDGIRTGLRQASGAPLRKQYVASIIVPVFNKVELTQQCLAALAEVTDEVEYEVIVVDDASTDGTQAFLRSLGGDVQILRNEQNSGFAKSCNRGAAAARGRFLVFLNNDTVPLKGWLSALVKEVESHPDVAVVGSKLLYPDNTIQHAGVAFSKFAMMPYHLYPNAPADNPVVNRRREMNCVTAACVLIRRAAFEAAGGFDEGYRNSFEDVDLCLKIREQGGRIIYQPASTLYHLESQSPGRKAHDEANAARLRERMAHMWWLPDEDIYYVADGLAYEVYPDGHQARARFKPFADATVKAAWELVAEAQRCAWARDLDGLRRVLSRVDSWPGDLVVLQWAATLCRAVKLTELSYRFWERILLLGEDPPARVALAQRALERGDLREADTHLATALAQVPTFGPAWLVRGVMLMSRQAYAEAATAFARAVEHGGDQKKAQLGLVMAAMGQQAPEQAWNECHRLMERYPDDQDVLHWLVRAGTALERWDGLAGELIRYLARNPGDLAARFALAGSMVRLGRIDAAKREYDTIRLLSPGFEGLADLAKVLGARDCDAAPTGRG